MNKPWATYLVMVHGNVQALLDISITSTVGSGANTLFWEDRGCTVTDIHTLLRTCSQQFQNGSQSNVPFRKPSLATSGLGSPLSLAGLGSPLSLAVLSKYLLVWEVMEVYRSRKNWMCRPGAVVLMVIYTVGLYRTICPSSLVDSNDPH